MNCRCQASSAIREIGVIEDSLMGVNLSMIKVIERFPSVTLLYFGD